MNRNLELLFLNPEWRFMNNIEERLKNAKALLEAGKGEAARILLLEILKNDPDNTTALLMLGGAYFMKKNMPKRRWYMSA